MPGFVGCVSPKFTQDLLQNLVDPLMHNEDYTSSILFLRKNMALAKIFPGGFQGLDTAYYNENKELVAFIDGIIIVNEETKLALNNKGHEITDNSSDEQMIIHMYEEYGDDFAKYLSGNFIVIIVNLVDNSLLIANDRFGTRLIYYLAERFDFFFAPELKSFFKLTNSLTFNWEGVAEFLHFGHMLTDNTWFNEIKVMDPASILRYKNGILSIHHYTLTQEIDKNCEIDQIAFEWKKTVSKRIEKLQKNGLKVGVDLTGGCDTRVILASLDSKQKKNICATTFSFPETTELYIAKQVAKTAQINHFISELSAVSLFKWSRNAVYVSDGMHFPLHLLNPDKLKGKIDVVVDGIGLGWFLGGSFFKDDVLDSIKDCDVDKMINILYKKPYGGIIFDECELRESLHSNFLKKIRNKALLSTKNKFKTLLLEYRDLGFCLNLFLLWNRSRRHISMGSYVFRSKIERFSLADSELLFRIGLTKNPKIVARRRLERDLLMKLSPELAKIPYDATGLPICIPYRLWSFGKIFLFMLNNLAKGFGKIKLNIMTNFFVHGPNSLDDFTFLKSSHLWCNFLQDLIIGQRSLSRNFFQKSYLLSLWQDFLNGKNVIKKVLILSTLELWFRILEDEHNFILNKNGITRL